MELRKAFKRFAKNHSNNFTNIATVYEDTYRMVYVCQPVIDSWVAMSPHPGGPMELPHDLGVVLYTPE